MSQGSVRRDPDIVANEGQGPRVGRPVRDPEVWRPRDAMVSRLGVEHIYQTVSGIQPSIVEDHTDEPLRYRHPRKEVVVGGGVIVYSDRFAPSNASVGAPAG